MRCSHSRDAGLVAEALKANGISAELVGVSTESTLVVSPATVINVVVDEDDLPQALEIIKGLNQAEPLPEDFDSPPPLANGETAQADWIQPFFSGIKWASGIVVALVVIVLLLGGSLRFDFNGLLVTIGFVVFAGGTAGIIVDAIIRKFKRSDLSNPAHDTNSRRP